MNTEQIQQVFANMIRIGTVSAVNYSQATCRVRDGEIETPHIPFATNKAQGNITWHPVEIDEQVIFIAPSGDLSQAVVIGSIYKSNQDANLIGLDRTTFADGTTVEYNRVSHELNINAGNATININADTINVNGNSGDIVVEGISLVHHTHEQNPGDHYGGGASTEPSK